MNDKEKKLLTTYRVCFYLLAVMTFIGIIYLGSVAHYYKNLYEESFELTTFAIEGLEYCADELNISYDDLLDGYMRYKMNKIIEGEE